MANYNSMKKDELIRVLKEKDEELNSARKTIGERDAKISGLTRDCEGMTEECNTFRNKVNGLKDDVEVANVSVKDLTNENNDLKNELNSCKIDLTIKDGEIHSLKHRYHITIGVLIVAVIIAIIF